MKGITGFQLRHETGASNSDSSEIPLPKAVANHEARARVLARLKTMGTGEFDRMSDDDYAAWVNALPHDEFIEMLSVVLEWDQKSAGDRGVHGDGH